MTEDGRINAHGAANRKGRYRCVRVPCFPSGRPINTRGVASVTVAGPVGCRGFQVVCGRGLDGLGQVMTVGVSTGHVVRFDDARGFGFIAPDGGGQEDVFVHANGVLDGKESLQVGTRVSFQTVGGTRGLKAYDVRVLGPDTPTSGGEESTAHAVQAPIRMAELNESCDVLTRAELTTETTEALLNEVGSLTAAQVLQVREVVLRLAARHDWLID